MGKSLGILNFSGAGVADPVIDIRAKVEERKRQEAELYRDQEPTGGSGQPPIDGKFIRQCLANNERGDGVLFATLHRGKFVCNLKERDATKDRGIWYSFNGVHWELDKRHLANNGVEEVAQLYYQESERLVPLIEESHEKLLEANRQVSEANKMLKKAEKDKAAALKAENQALTDEADQLKARADEIGFAAEEAAKQAKTEFSALKAEKKELDSRIDRLRSVNGIEKTLIMAHRIGPRDSLAVIGNEWDQKPWLLPCKNGVIDLQTGKLHNGRPEDYLLRAVPFEYRYDPDFLRTGNNSPSPIWDAFFREIHQDDEEIIQFVQRIIGYGITGHTSEHVFPVFVGAGRNGKGTMFEIIKYILNELAWAIQPEMLLEQKNSRSSAGPSADLVSLYGRRFVIASETDEGRKISAAIVKRLTGGDSLTVRAPFDKYEWGFTPTHSIYLYTNDLPWGLTKDFAMRQRLAMIDYPLRYVDDPGYEAQQDPGNAHLFRKKDKSLPGRLQAEAPGILMTLVRWCLLWQRDGSNPPSKVRHAVEDRSREEDTLGQFFDECLLRTEDDSDWETFKALYQHYERWWTEYLAGGKARPHSKKSFAQYLKSRGLECDHNNGRRYLRVRFADQYRFAE